MSSAERLRTPSLHGHYKGSRHRSDTCACVISSTCSEKRLRYSVIKASCPLSKELHRASSTTMTRKPRSTASSTVASTQTSVSEPVMISVATPFSRRNAVSPDSVNAEYAGLSMTVAGGIRRDRGDTISSCEDDKRDRVAQSHLVCQRPGLSSAFIGVINRVKTVRGGLRSAIPTITGSTRSIQGVCQIPPGANRFCISMDRWTAFEIGSNDCGSAMILRVPFRITTTCAID